MFYRSKVISMALLLSVTALLSACGGTDTTTEPVNIVETAKNDPKFSVFIEAIDAAGLASTLSGPGPFTVFAPTNSAFAALLTELGISKASMLADRALLSSVLTYHVLPAKFEKAQIPLGKPIKTVQGGFFKVDTVGNDVVITDERNRKTKISQTDIQATNGVLHAIDNVLLPADKNIVQTAQSLSQFTILVEAVVAAGLVDTLNGNGPFTVFAPTNAAFAALLAELGVTKEQLLANKPLLAKVLTYHVVPGRVLKADIPTGLPITTVQGESFSIDADLNITDRRSRIAKVTTTDVLARNGVIHVIDKVILPAR